MIISNGRHKIKHSTLKDLPGLTNNQVKLYASLRQKKYRRQLGLFIADGPHLVQAALNSDWEIEKIIIRYDRDDLIEKLNPPKGMIAIVPSAKFDRISPSLAPQGILAVVRMKDVAGDIGRFIKKARRVAAADSVSDPGNLGTIIRTAAAFGCDLMVCIGECAEIGNPKTVRATQGGLFAIPIFEIRKPREFLKLFAGQFNIVAFSGSAKKPLAKASRIKRPVLVFGGETSGISSSIENKADFRFRIEQTDKVESLNVAVAAGVAMYKFYRGWI